MTRQIVHVELGARGYAIVIGSDLLAEAPAIISQASQATHVVLITDTHVEKPHATTVAEHFADHGCRVDLMVVEPGESSKSVEMADQLWRQLLGTATDRQSLVVAVGGGVIGDLAGFVAATYARGLPFAQIPTTLLAQVDSSVGGKVAINLPSAKNMVGAFWQPSSVVIDTETLTTLPTREYRAGLGEVVKYGVIQDAAFFQFLEQHVEELNARHADCLRQVIARCCQLKADVVRADEREETGQRAILNYGHTFAHALEAVAGYGELLHGEAVSIGMVCASRLAESLGLVDPSLTERQVELLAALGLPTGMPTCDRGKLWEVMQSDKKVAHGSLRFVLPTQLGNVKLVADIEQEKVLAAMA
jgi:3-dehydroquinate synthase